ncbi:PBECR3 domain-containing polyvalent protein, partial [Helicobacter vulpis]
VRTMPHIPFFKGFNQKIGAAALRHHLKAALNKSHSVEAFKNQLNQLVQRTDFDNATKALIREIEGGLPPDDGGGGGLPLPKIEPSPETPKLEPTPAGGGKGGEPPKGELTPLKPQEALDLLENLNPQAVPPDLELDAFLKSLESVQNKENFIKHLQKKEDAQSRLAYLNLVEPTLHNWDLKIISGDRSEYIKAFRNGDQFFSLLITQENDQRLITFIPKVREKFLQDKIKNASLIQAFTSRAGDSSLNLHPNPTTPELKSQDGTDLPTKSTLKEDLSPQEIKGHIEGWDLANPKATDRLLIAKIEGEELEQLKSEFSFKGNYALAREIDAQHVAHALNRHGDLKVETSRNQIPITMEDISNYPNIIKEADIREIEGNNIVYKKQINGHYVVVEEALTKKNKISFVTMWKSKGDLTTLPTPSSKGYDLDRTLSESYKEPNPTTPELKSQAQTLYTQAQEQEHGFKQLLEGLSQPSSTLESGNVLKSVGSIEEKLAYYKGDSQRVDDLLRGAFIAPKESIDKQFKHILESLQANPSIEDINPRFIKTQDNYQGAHI